jgi:hypothetical protein
MFPVLLKKMPLRRCDLPVLQEKDGSGGGVGENLRQGVQAGGVGGFFG